MTTRPTIGFLAEILARKPSLYLLRVLAFSNAALKEEDILKAVNLRLNEEGNASLTLEDARKQLHFLRKRELVRQYPPDSHELTEWGKAVANDLFPI